MPTYSATWPDVPQFAVSGDDLFDVLARAAHEYEAFVGDADDDPDYMPPEFRWELAWHENRRRRLVLVADGTMTAVHVDEVGGPIAQATLYPESVVLHNAAIHHALRREVNRIAAHAATEDRTLRWVADELVDALATNPYPDGSPADEIERLRAELAATYVQAIDFDGESVWQDPDTGMVVWTPPGYDGKATRVLEPLYRRVTEPAGSVTA